MAIGACSCVCAPSFGCLVAPRPLISPPKPTFDANLAKLSRRPFRPSCSSFGPQPSLFLGRQLRAELAHDMQSLSWSGRLSKFPACHRPVRGVAQAAELSALGGRTHDGALEQGGYQSPSREDLQRLAQLPLQNLVSAAARVRNQREDSQVVTFSPKVFIPLTRLCRDACGYCTFAMGPKAGERAYMTLDEVLAVAQAGKEAGCTEALFTLGDKPELLYTEAKDELASLGFDSTLAYVQAAAALVLRETGLLPHINAGVMGRRHVAALKKVSASQGLMLESLSERLFEPGGPHFGCPDKRPAARLATIAAAGEERVPFTTGLLIGIGETREERLEALLAIRQLHEKYGHVQELIIQNFRRKEGTAMSDAPEPSIEELLWTVAMARLAFGPAMSIQAPPNLTPAGPEQSTAALEWQALIGAGINDWGGISPVTKDWVNPEAPWPHISVLADATRAAGKVLVPRLAVYPEYLADAATWLDPEVTRVVLASSDALGYARAEDWSPGLALQPPPLLEALSGGRNDGGVTSEEHAETCQPATDEEASDETNGRGTEQTVKSEPSTSGRFTSEPTDRGGDRFEAFVKEAHLSSRTSASRDSKIQVSADGTLYGRGRPSADDGLTSAGLGVSPGVRDVLSRAMDGQDLTEAEIEGLFRARGDDFVAICQAADELRRQVNGDKVTYVVNRNINYTNVCTYRCQFCAFSKGRFSENLRGKPYVLALEEIGRRATEAWARGATEVCMQGGIHPDFTGQTYLDILAVVKAAAPDIHVHAFSPLEVFQGAATLGISVDAFLGRLQAAGLGSLPGTAAEVLDDEVRTVLCPDKLTTAEWLGVVEAAHRTGLRTTSTIMFGHLDRPRNWARHLLHLRDLQKRTRGITEFVPLPFVHMEAPVFLKGRARRGPTMRECTLMHAVARLALHPHIANIQASWVKMGPGGAQSLLAVGCNDMGGSLMNESITRAAGAEHGQELAPSAMEALITSLGRRPEQRTTPYGTPPLDQTKKSFVAAPLTHLAMV